MSITHIIEEMASRPNVKKVAVENFLLSAEPLSFGDALENLRLDCRLYKWNAETVRAIRKGLWDIDVLKELRKRLAKGAER